MCVCVCVCVSVTRKEELVFLTANFSPLGVHSGSVVWQRWPNASVPSQQEPGFDSRMFGPQVGCPCLLALTLTLSPAPVSWPSPCLLALTLALTLSPGPDPDPVSCQIGRAHV